MFKHFLFVLLTVFVLAACDDGPPKRVFPKGRAPIIAEKEFPKDKETPIEIPPPPAPYTGPKKFCFEMELGNNPNDMTRMQFILDDNDSIRGRLDHTFADRTPIRGNIEGVKKGEFIELSYAYTDSGIHKTQQLNLKMENEKLYKKTGALVEEDGILVLEEPLKATLQLFLMKVDCK